MILHTEYLRNATRKLLELIHEFGRVVGYKVNTQKSLVFLYTNNKMSERKIKKTISFTIATKKKYVGINLLKETKVLYSKNYKILMKETEDDTNRCSLTHKS